MPHRHHSRSKAPTRCFSYSAMLPDFSADVTSCVQKIMSWAQSELSTIFSLQAFPCFQKSRALLFLSCSENLYMVNRMPKDSQRITISASRIQRWHMLWWISYRCQLAIGWIRIVGTEKYWNWSRLCGQHHLSGPFTAPPRMTTTALVGQVKY